jgi:hypothetical protein
MTSETLALLFKPGRRQMFVVRGVDFEQRTLTGRVLTYGELTKPGMVRVTVRDDEGRVHVLRGRIKGPGNIAFDGHAVDLDAAAALARAQLEGRRINVGVEAAMNELAAAVLQLKASAP